MSKTLGRDGVTGLCEIGGGYLVWLWLREGWGLPVGLLGALVLFAYGILPTLQTAHHFSRVYAAYGGLFILMALVWGARVEGKVPDQGDLVGAGVATLGALLILYWPRG